MAIVVFMFSAFTQNELLLSMMATLAGDEVDLEPARKAFETTAGDFRAKFTAAVQARLAGMAVPEVFIDLPDDPERLRKSDLEALVRPAADGFMRSYPSKGELLEQAARIRRRQQRRPEWIPRVGPDGEPTPSPGTGSPVLEREPDRTLVVAALAELGEVTVRLPAAEEERPELAMVPGGIGEWETALHTVLGVVAADAPAATVPLDATANEAMVPEEMRWWASEPPQPVPATQDPGVASELLATLPTAGGLAVFDTPEGYEAVVNALACAGDWRYSPRWQLESWDPGDNIAALTIARAAVAGWADESQSGVIMYVFGGALYADESLVSVPSPLHSYLLTMIRSVDGTDTVDAVHRTILSCPGEYWCHRGGCPEVDIPDVGALLARIVTAAQAAEVAAGAGGWAAESYQRLYGHGDGSEYTDSVLEQLTAILSGAGWVALEQSTWDGGLEQVLLRRGEHCLTAVYDPVTRQLQLVDGKSELNCTLHLLADDGVFTDDGDRESIDISEAAVERWGTDLLTAADDLLRGRITELPQLAVPLQATVLGLHPQADGTLRGPEAATLGRHQVSALLATAGVLMEPDRSVLVTDLR
ncbi:hypothetical protein OG777_10525 [Micromonospora peucetia]|uniref:hypothetical protein n=1 Tax=Micromonospora peucetia TaxID=47871 RepID=UPI0022534709|nr:hypothetical protein [Micromonospora peucetia]MCX4387367.1 hypothetical protein [Micromonospora peucetia]